MLGGFGGAVPAAHRHGLWPSRSWPTCLPPPRRLSERVAWPRPPTLPSLPAAPGFFLGARRDPRSSRSPHPCAWRLCPSLPQALLPAQQPGALPGAALPCLWPAERTLRRVTELLGQRWWPRLSGPGCLGSLGPRFQDPFMARRSCCPISGQAWPFPAWPLPGSPRPGHPLPRSPPRTLGPSQGPPPPWAPARMDT